MAKDEWMKYAKAIIGVIVVVSGADLIWPSNFASFNAINLGPFPIGGVMGFVVAVVGVGYLISSWKEKK